MCEMTRFWLDWGVQFLVAAGTLGAVYAALFGDSFRAKRVKLRASIENSLGVYTPTRTQVVGVRGGNVTFGGYNAGEARYYQLRVSNASRRFPAHRVDVWLLRIDQFGEDGGVQTWTGEIPLIWQHQNHLPGPRIVGNSANVDLFAISGEMTSRNRVLDLQLQIGALNAPKEHREACKLLLTIQVRSDESNSAESRIRVEWDGQWECDDDAMSQHVIFEIADESD